MVRAAQEVFLSVVRGYYKHHLAEMRDVCVIAFQYGGLAYHAVALQQGEYVPHDFVVVDYCRFLVVCETELRSDFCRLRLDGIADLRGEGELV